MLAPTSFDVSGRRLNVTYEVGAGDAEVAEVARWLAGESTVEFPLELIPDDDIGRHVVAEVASIEPCGEGRYQIALTVAEEVVAGSMTQLLSVVWGNVSLARSVRLVALEVPVGWPQPDRDLRGIEGFRVCTGARGRPLLMSAIKPLGLPVARLAALAGQLAGGGLDVVKEDQSLADQPFAPFLDRIGPIADAITAANERYGTRAVYAPSLNGPVADLPDRAAAARDAGAGAVMVQPGISGFPAIEAAGQAGLLVIAHPGGLGSMTDRVAAGLVHGTLPRMAGADCSVFVTAGGRFAVPEADTDAIVRGCLAPAGGLPPILPAAGGGVTLERVPQIRERFGDDVCLLIGGDLHRNGDPGRRAAQLREAVGG